MSNLFLPPFPPAQPERAQLDWLRQPPRTPTVARGECAGVLRRGIALLFDGIVLFVLWYAAGVLVGDVTVKPVEPGDRVAWATFTLDQWQARGVVLGWFLYLIATEARFGATLGKRLVGITVRRDDWSPITVRAAVLRQLTHLLPVVAITHAGSGPSVTPAQIAVYVVGAIIARSSIDRQRLGDRLAGTIVARRSSLPAPVPATGNQSSEPLVAREHACFRCGTSLLATDRFCPACGATAPAVVSAGTWRSPEPASPRVGTRVKLALAIVAAVAVISVILVVAGQRRVATSLTSDASSGLPDLAGTIVVEHPDVRAGASGCVLPAPNQTLVPGALITVLDENEVTLNTGAIEESLMMGDGICHLNFAVPDLPEAREYRLVINGIILPAVSYGDFQQHGWHATVRLNDFQDQEAAVPSGFLPGA